MTAGELYDAKFKTPMLALKIMYIAGLLAFLGFATNTLGMLPSFAALFLNLAGVASVLIGLPLGVLLSIRRRQFWLSHNYEWYASQNPEACDNKILCSKCKSSKIASSAYKKKTYMLYHYCHQCRSILYYTPEKI